jgi:putative NADH-flavin reductase
VKITVFGATGRTGHLLTRQALDAGHHVTAYARDPGKLRIADPRLTVVRGELDDAAAIRRAVDSADAVIEGVGSVSDGTRRIAAAMAEAAVRRFVVISTCSVTDPADLPDVKVKALVRLVKRVAPGPYREVRQAAEVVRATELDWTLVRVARLTDAPATGRIRIGHYGHHAVGLSISRTDLAAFLLAQTDDSTYLRAAPAISG